MKSPASLILLIIEGPYGGSRLPIATNDRNLNLAGYKVVYYCIVSSDFKVSYVLLSALGLHFHLSKEKELF